MTTLGRNVKLTLPESARPTARAMFEVLGVKLMTPNAQLDVFQLDGGNFGIEYSANALTAAQMKVAPWLEIAVANVEATSSKLAAIGLPRLEYKDKEHPYFVGPGGVVFRLARER